jgi:hypothetical protein
MFHQRKPATGSSSITSNMASPTQPKSNRGMADRTCFKSICRETYQKQTPVTSNLAANIASFSAPPLRGGRFAVSRSLATLLPIRICFNPTIPDGGGGRSSVTGQAPRHGNGRGKGQVQARNRTATRRAPLIGSRLPPRRDGATNRYGSSRSASSDGAESRCSARRPTTRA